MHSDRNLTFYIVSLLLPTHERLQLVRTGVPVLNKHPSTEQATSHPYLRARKRSLCPFNGTGKDKQGNTLDQTWPSTERHNLPCCNPTAPPPTNASPPVEKQNRPLSPPLPKVALASLDAEEALGCGL